jgi:GcrA cell cycle regulator
MSWTDERVETLKAMWSEGKSASQIAKELGGVTRNAVIGKVHRLGLSNRGPGADRPEDAMLQGAEPLPEPEAEPIPSMTERVAAPEVMDPPRPTPREPVVAQIRPKPVAVPGQPLPPQPAGAEMSPEALANLEEVAKKARRLTLMQLTERTCKWPVGDPATDDFWFCGLPTVPGKPYCETHVAVAFQPMSARRDRRAGGR